MEQLHNFIKNGQNVVILGERRVGKTSLINEAVRQLKSTKMIYTNNKLVSGFLASFTYIITDDNKKIIVKPFLFGYILLIN